MPSTNITVPTKDNDTIAGRIVRAREAAGMSTNELAERIGVTRKTMETWETDRAEPRSDKLNMLAGLMGVSPTWLLYGRGGAPQESLGTSDISKIEDQLARLQELHDQTGDMIKGIESALKRIEIKDRE